MSKKIKVKNLEKTCSACPSQWEGETKGGDYVYIRFRWGFLSAEVNGKTVYGEGISDGLDGTLSTPEMKRRLKHVFKFFD